MRLIMLGTGSFGVPTLRALTARGHDVALVVSRPPRDRNQTASPLQRAAEELGLEVWTPETANSPEAQTRLASFYADLLVVCDYGEILRPETLSAGRLGGNQFTWLTASQVSRRGARPTGDLEQRI